MKDKVYIFGLTVIITSFITCVVSFYLLIYGIPGFVVGVVAVLVSKRTLKIKMVTTLTPLIVYVPLTYLFLLAYNYSTPKTILIPCNYAGTLRIIYEEKCGGVYEEIKEIKTLRFPKNGILILSEDFDRHIDYNYYLIDKLENIKEIPVIFDVKDRTRKMPCIMFESSGTIGEAIETDSPTKEKKGILFSDFYLFSEDNSDRNDLKSQTKFDSLTMEVVTQCRTSQ